MQNITEGIIVLDEKGVIQSSNKAAELLFGSDHSKLRGQKFNQLIDKKNHKQLKKYLSNESKHLDTWQGLQARRSDNSRFPLEIAVNSLELADGTYFSLIVRDLSEHDRVEEALRASEERFNSAFTNSAIGMALVDADHKIIQVNQALINIFGYTEAELLDSYMRDITLERDIFISLEQHNKMVNGELDHYQFEIRFVHKNGDIIWSLLSVSAVRDRSNKFLHAITQIQDITDARKLSAKLAYQSSHDELTSLFNRREFENRIERLVDTVSKEKAEHALCYIDLDQFKIINDTCGHVAGDELLRQISALMSSKVRHQDTLARLGGDEFGLLMDHCPINQAERVANVLLAVIKEFRFTWNNKSYSIGASIGVVPINENNENITELLRHADAACYVAKNAGRNRIQVYYPKDSELKKMRGEMRGVERLNKAFAKNQLVLYCQPIVPVNGADRDYIHYEILVRIKGDRGEIISPEIFLPAAERYNLISKLDQWVVENLFRWLSNHRFSENISCCSINLSGQTVGDPEFLIHIKELLDTSSITASKVCFEITETSAIANLSNARRFMDSMKEIGCMFALDDFGSGLSSFAYLKNLPVDFLKIDGVFIKDLLNNPIDSAMVRSINEIGHVMGIKTIAEFVENKKILKKLQEIGVDYAQGYGIGMPTPLEEIIIW